MTLPAPISLHTDNQLETIWDQLSLFESETYALKIVQTKDTSESKLEESVYKGKAQALAFCIRNAREYLKHSHSSLTSQASANYYGCLWLAASLAVANPTSDANLETLEASTINGHGLGSVSLKSEDFPVNEYVFLKKQGFFKDFVRWNQYPNWQSLPFVESKKAHLEESRSRRENFADLLGRIPELVHTFETVTERRPMCFEIFPGPNELNVSLTSKLGHNVIGIKGNYSKEYLIQCRLPFGEQLSEYTPKHPNSEYADSRWAAEYGHGFEEDFFDKVYKDVEHHQFYQSPLLNYFYIAPIFGVINDPIAIHLVLNYQLSILARYRPATWRSIIEGNHDQYRSLINQYYRIFARIVPHFVLSRLWGRRVHLVSPGAW